MLVDRVNIAGSENGQQASDSRQGLGHGRPHVEPRRHRHHRHVRDRRLPDLLRLRRLPGDRGHHGWQRPHDQAGGIGINLTTKRGTNTFHGGGRFYHRPRRRAASATCPSPRRTTRGSRTPTAPAATRPTTSSRSPTTASTSAARSSRTSCGSTAPTASRTSASSASNGTPDKTLLPSLQRQAELAGHARTTMVSAFYFIGAKQKFGRDPGIGVIPDGRVPWNQDNASDEGGLPGGLWKLQIDQTFSPELLRVRQGRLLRHRLLAHARRRTDQTLDRRLRSTARASARTPYYSAIRPQKNITVDANYFFQGMGGSHELKFGFAWRDYKTISTTTVGGNGLVGYLETRRPAAPGAPTAARSRSRASEPTRTAASTGRLHR